MAPEYEIRESFNTEPGDFQIAKFNGSSEPEKVYTVWIVRGKPNCSCPGFTYRGICKHIKMIRDFLKGKEAEKWV